MSAAVESNSHPATPAPAGTVGSAPTAQSGLVCIVDDDASIRRGLMRLLRSAGYSAEGFESADAFLASGRFRDAPACLVLDVRMPGLSGPDLQDRLVALKATIGIVFITGHGDIPTVVRAMKGGAVDLLPKPFTDDQLLGAIKIALERSGAQRRERSELDSIQQRLATLSPREREVMALITQGWLNKQVAAEIGTVEKTVKVHRSRVMEKMKVTSLAELVRLIERVRHDPAALAMMGDDGSGGVLGAVLPPPP